MHLPHFPTVRAPLGSKSKSIGYRDASLRLGPRAATWSLMLLPLALLACTPGAGAHTDILATDSNLRGLIIVDTNDPRTQAEGVPDRANFHSFGEVPDGSIAKHTFRMKNVESSPISIMGIHPGCGCTAAQVTVTTASGETIEGQKPQEPRDPWVVVPPGGQVDLTLRIDTRDIASKNKDRTMTTRVVTDAEVGRYRTFEMHLIVAQELQVNPKTLNLGQVAVGLGAAGTVDIVPIGAGGVQVVGVKSSPEGVQVQVSPAEILGRSTWEVQASVDPPLELGQLFGNIVIETRNRDGTPGHDLTIPFLARVVPDLHVDPLRLVLVNRPSNAEPGASCKVSSLRPGERLKITSSRLEGEGADAFEFVVLPDDPDARGRSHTWTVSLRPRGDWPSELLRGQVVLNLERSGESEMRFAWVCHPD